ncbi:MAG: hypothetical protein ABL895_16190 [Cyclobacteriaceae bacterium]
MYSVRIYKLLTLLFITSVSPSFAQVYSDKIIGEKNEAKLDSLKKQDYPYALPIWGQAATKKGFQLPYSAGVSINYFWQQSDIILSDLSVGFNGGPMYDLDQIVRFKNSTATASALNFRPDIWLFPFLNVYGILAKANTSTAIEAGVYIPDFRNNWVEIASFKSKADFDATSFGFGLTPTIGVGGGWLALDMNFTWTDVSALDKPVFTSSFGPRLGKTFKFKKPERNIAVWVGGFRVNYTPATNGSLALSEVLPIDEMQTKVDDGLVKIDEKQTEVNDWWGGLTPKEKTDPSNVAIYTAANKALESASNIFTALDGALSTAETSTVQYSLTKQLKDKWNFIIGSQFQFNRHFMLRAEYGFLGSRQQFLTGIQYRFGL